MKCLSVLLAASLGTLVYVSVSVAGGKDGILAEKKLAEQKRIISVRTAEIQKINNELSLEYIGIQSDSDVITAYAKRLGYVRDNEKLVKIAGLPAAPVMEYNTGTVLKHQESVYLPEWVCKVMGFTVFLLALVFMILFEFRRDVLSAKKQKDEMARAKFEYDMPQI